MVEVDSMDVWLNCKNKYMYQMWFWLGINGRQKTTVNCWRCEDRNWAEVSEVCLRRDLLQMYIYRFHSTNLILCYFPQPAFLNPPGKSQLCAFFRCFLVEIETRASRCFNSNTQDLCHICREGEENRPVTNTDTDTTSTAFNKIKVSHRQHTDVLATAPLEKRRGQWWTIIVELSGSAAKFRQLNSISNPSSRREGRKTNEEAKCDVAMWLKGCVQTGKQRSGDSP